MEKPQKPSDEKPTPKPSTPFGPLSPEEMEEMAREVKASLLTQARFRALYPRPKE